MDKKLDEKQIAENKAEKRKAIMQEKKVIFRYFCLF